MERLHLYMDDSGSRRPDHHASSQRADGMDCFALGGFLINQNNIRQLIESHRQFVSKWKLTAPLHSTRIRGQRGAFAWLGTDDARRNDFLGELETMILSLPITGIACVIDRPGYVGRYAAQYKTPWLLCKTAFAILIERSVKYATSAGARLEIYFEQAGKQEDRDIQRYAKDLESEGMPFNPDSSGPYGVLDPVAFRESLIGQPNRVTKATPMAQIADLILYPMVKGGYDPTYRPYVKMFESRRIIDAQLSAEDRPRLGVKYSCFDQKK
jgi:hypothetical protein